MNQTTNLLLFSVLVFGIVVLPGLDMAFVLASSLSGGRKSGLYATAGIVAGGVVHVTIGALGIAVALKTFPQLFNLLLLAGAAYLCWIGLSLMRSGISFTSLQPTHVARRAFRRGMLTNLLNPKAYLFMLAVFPQFVRPDGGPVWLQALPMGVIIALIQVAVYGFLAMLAARSSEWLLNNPAWNARIGQAIGATLFAIALGSAIQGWHSIT